MLHSLKLSLLANNLLYASCEAQKPNSEHRHIGTQTPNLMADFNMSADKDSRLRDETMYIPINDLRRRVNYNVVYLECSSTSMNTNLSHPRNL